MQSLKLFVISVLLSLTNGLESNTLTVGLESNSPGSPQVLSDTYNVCMGQGRTAICEVELDVPASCVDSFTGESSCPIVFFLHGAGGTNNGFASSSGVHEEEMIGIYPQGENGWNTGPKSTNDCQWDDYSCTTDPDEGDFIKEIIAEVRTLGANGNIYVIGSSNGAALANVLAVNAGDELPIKGFVSLVTQLLESPDRSGPGNLNYCNPDARGGIGPKVSVLNVLGTNDAVIPYEGGSSFVFEGVDDFQLMPALDSMETWAVHNGCNPTPIVTNVVTDTAAGGDGTGVFYEYVGCQDGTVVEHYAINGGGHNAGISEINNIEARDIQFDFIRRVEDNAGPTPTSTPTISPSPTVSSPPSFIATPQPSVGCTDDPDWLGQFSPPSGQPHNCFFVSLVPSFRCDWKSSEGIFAYDACKVACGTCPVAPSQSPTSSCQELPNSLIVGQVKIGDTIFATCAQLSNFPQFIDAVCNLDPKAEAEALSPAVLCGQTCGTGDSDEPISKFLALIVRNNQPVIFEENCDLLASQSQQIKNVACNLDLSVWDSYVASSLCCETCS